MDEIVMAACIALILIGTFSAIFGRDPFDKLISLSVMIAGIFPFIVDRGYLDVGVPCGVKFWIFGTENHADMDWSIREVPII